ncbi:paramyosin-like [Haliotis cracherodii]|uniref:paramyosin-like n=1 Tax=Haliotis cracherodii TaxID=6455 RepID=UPI0039E79272
MHEQPLLLFFLLPSYVSGLILPLTKPDGSADLTSVLGHVTLLEQTVDNLQKNTVQLQTDLQVTNAKLQTTQTDLQTTQKDLQNTQTELAASEAKQQSADADILSLRNDVSTLKTELVLVKSKLQNVNPVVSSPKVALNVSILDSLSHDVKANTADVKALGLELKSVHTDLNATASTLLGFQSDLHSFKFNVSSVLTTIKSDYDDLKSHVDLNVHNKVTSNSANVTTLQSDVNVLAKLDILNTTVYAVQSEARRLTKNVSSMVQLLEHKQLVENMDTQSVKTLAQDTSIQLKLLEKDVNATSFDVGHIKKNLHSMDADLHVVQNDVSMTRSEIQTMKQTMSDIDKNSTAVKQALAQVAQTMASKTRDVAFQAYLSATQTVQSGTSLIFHRVFLNSGSGYNSTTGRFTAPVSGTFLFWTQLDVDQADVSLTISIHKSGTSIGTGWVKTTTDSDDEVVSVITASHVTAGEEVWVQVNLTALIYGSSYSHFGGTILSVD